MEILWLIHTAHDWAQGQYTEWDWHNREQWVLVPVSVLEPVRTFLHNI